MSRPVSDIKGYHAHIYYTPETKAVAARVRQGLSLLNVRLGSWHDELVGPHLKPMYQALFTADEFDKVVPWLMLNREGLHVLVHPETGDGRGDHLDRSLWLGEKLGVNLKAFKK
jgi:aromatic ring-cleaving dioxygenase